MLEGRRYAQVDGLRHAVEPHRLPAHRDAAGIRLLQTGQHMHQRGFAGAVVGALVMGVINQGLSIMGVDTAVVKTIKGLVLLGAGAVDLLSKRTKS